MFKTLTVHSLLLGVASAVVLYAPAAWADEATADAEASTSLAGEQGNDLGEIVVSARRREERAQDVPISLSAIDNQTLTTTSYANITQIASLIPSVNIRAGNARNTFINIRGLGSNSTQNDGLEIGIGTYIDDVYYGRVGSSQFDIIDLERFEVLRGPQGTLFGKNTTSGAINITTREPSFTPEFRGEASIGETGFWQVRGTASTALVPDQLAIRLTGSYGEDDGFYYNAYTGRKTGGSEDLTLRGQLLYLPTDRIRIRVIGDYSRQQTTGAGAAWIGTFTTYDNGARISNNIIDRTTRLGYSHPNAFDDPYERIVNTNARTGSDMNSWGVSAKADIDLDWATLTSITAYRRWNWYPYNDSDGTSLDINPKGGTTNHQRQFSQEIRLASQGTRKIDYVVGAYYFAQVIEALSEYRLGSDYAAWNNPTANQTIANYAYTGFQADSAAEPKTKSYAVFGQATWNANEELSVTAGLRFTHEDRSASYNQYASRGNDLSLLSPADRTVAHPFPRSSGSRSSSLPRRVASVAISRSRGELRPPASSASRISRDRVEKASIT